MRRLAEYATIAGHKSFLYNFRARGGSLAADAYGPSHTFEVYPGKKSTAIIAVAATVAAVKATEL